MVNASLTYEILMYLNSFYFGMFSACELGMGVLKAINLQYQDKILAREAIILIALCVVETIRILLGRKGSLSERAWQVFVSVLLLIPCGAGVIYFLLYQTYILKLETILLAIMLVLYSSEFFFAILFLFTMCQPPTYY